MAKRTIPDGPQQLTPEWLTEALRSTNTIRAAAVTSFDTTIIGEGVGILGQLARLDLTYDRPEEGAPLALIAKFPAATPENREIGSAFKFYERENNFYDQVADTIDLGTARCYYSDMAPEASQHVLLLEDLSGYRLGDQLAGCSPADADVAVRQLAKFHASWWESPRLAEVGWIPSPSDPIVVDPLEQSYADAWAPFLQNFGDSLSSEITAVGERLGANIRRLINDLDAPPRTIIHGDFRLDNMFFFDGTSADAGSIAGSAIAEPSNSEPFKLIDWQICMRAAGTYDIGYFMSQSVPPEQRKSTEMDVLRMYHDTLVQHGVSGYSFDQCFEDYRRVVLSSLVYPVTAGGGMDLSNERGRTLVETMLNRCVTAIGELNAGELLPA